MELIGEKKTEERLVYIWLRVERKKSMANLTGVTPHPASVI